jgi:beta-N-acetylhexosaminidase
MGSVSINRDPGDAAVKACGAGADLLLVCHSPAGQISAQGAIARAVTSGKLRSENIKGSLERIRALKEKIREWGEAAGSQEPEDGDALAREVAEAAITLAGDPNKILPLRVGGGEKLLVLAPAMGPLSRAEEGGSHDDALSSLIRERRPEASVIQYEIIPSKENLASVREGLDGADVVIMGTCNAHFYSEQEELIREVATSGKSSVFAALRDPYDLELFPGASARVAAYGADPHTTAALIKVLFGDIPARGKLPVALSM